MGQEILTEGEVSQMGLVGNRVPELEVRVPDTGEARVVAGLHDDRRAHIEALERPEHKGAEGGDDSERVEDFDGGQVEGEAEVKEHVCGQVLSRGDACIGSVLAHALSLVVPAGTGSCTDVGADPVFVRFFGLFGGV